MSASWQDLLQAEAAGGIVIDAVEGTGTMTRGPKPGDVVKFHKANGQGYETRMGSDSTLADPVPSSRLPDPKIRTGNDAYPSAQDLAPNAPKAAKDFYEAARKDPNSNMVNAMSVLMQEAGKADTASRQAAADQKVKDADSADLVTARQKLAAGSNDFTQGEARQLALHQAGQAQQQYVMPVDGYTAPIMPHHAGDGAGAVDFFQPNGSVVRAVTSGTIVRSGPFGTAGNDIYLKGDDGKYYDYEHVAPDAALKAGDRVTPGQQIATIAPLAEEGASAGDVEHVHVAISGSPTGVNYDNHGTAADFDSTGFFKQLQSGQQPGVTPGNPYQPKPSLHTIGSQIVSVTPDGKSSIVFDGTGLATPAHFTVQSGGHDIVMQWNPTSKSFQQTFRGDLSPTEQAAQQGKFQMALEQAQNTSKYISMQLANGSLTPAEAQQYQSLNLQYANAAFKGTTPWDMQKQEEEQATQRAQIGKDLLNKQLETGAQMADSLIGNGIQGVTASKYGQMGAGTLQNIYEGVMRDTQNRAGGQGMTDLAQQLIQGIAPHAAAAGINPRMDILSMIQGGGQPTPDGTQPAPGPPHDATMPGPGSPGFTGGGLQGLAVDDPARLAALQQAA